VRCRLRRVLRSGELERRIAELLPPLPAIEEGRRHSAGTWEVFTDWLSRPFASESGNTGIQLAAGARGAGAVLTAKLAALCVGGVVAVGGGSYCVTTLLQRDPPKARHGQPAKRPASVTPRAVNDKPPKARLMKAAQKASGQRAGTTRSSERSAQRSRSGETAHERQAAVSPPIVQSSGAPVDEFGPGPTNTAPAQPAAPPSSGAPEFP
jgi:hypothetical protein